MICNNFSNFVVENILIQKLDRDIFYFNNLHYVINS